MRTPIHIFNDFLVVCLLYHVKFTAVFLATLEKFIGGSSGDVWLFDRHDMAGFRDYI